MTTSAIIFQREKKLSHFKMLSHFQYLIQSNLMPLHSFVLLTKRTVFICTEKQQEWMRWVEKNPITIKIKPFAKFKNTATVKESM